jgi:hypothetical protein
MDHWLRRLWNDIRPNLIWWILSSGTITGIIAGFHKFANNPIDGATAAVIFGVCFFGLLIIFFINRPHRTKPIVAGGVLMRTIVYLPILAGLAFCVWAYFIGTAVLRMKDDAKHLRAQMVRYVLPRQLTPEQIESIGEYLSHQENNQVVMQVVNRDEEASSYRANIQQALEKGGWAVSDIKFVDDIEEGLSLSIQSPLAPPETPYDRLHPRPRPTEILAQAFKRAGVQIQGMGGGSGVAVTTTTIIISIGHRRRDAWAVVPPNFEVESHTHTITDDDFGTN